MSVTYSGGEDGSLAFPKNKKESPIHLVSPRLLRNQYSRQRATVGLPVSLLAVSRTSARSPPQLVRPERLSK